MCVREGDMEQGYTIVGGMTVISGIKSLMIDSPDSPKLSVRVTVPRVRVCRLFDDRLGLMNQSLYS